jgi:hypothetical protein
MPEGNGDSESCNFKARPKTGIAWAAGKAVLARPSAGCDMLSCSPLEL